VAERVYPREGTRLAVTQWEFEERLSKETECAGEDVEGEEMRTWEMH